MDEPWHRARLAREVVGVGADVPVRVLGEGQSATALLVGTAQVVRFPRHALGVSHLIAERRLVAVLADLLPDVALPEPGPAALADDEPRPFAVHELVPGDVLSRDRLLSAGDDEALLIANEVVKLLNGLAGAADAARHANVPSRSLHDLADGMAGDVDRLVADRISPAVHGRIQRLIAAFAAADTGLRRLCHTDLGGNLLWDPGRRRLGVIDLGAAVISDPVLDLASLSVLGTDFARTIAARAPHLADRLVDAAAVRATFALQDALLAARQSEWGYADAVLSTM